MIPKDHHIDQDIEAQEDCSNDEQVKGHVRLVCEDLTVFPGSNRRERVLRDKECEACVAFCLCAL